MVTFDHIELTEEEIEDVLKKGREEKYYRLQREAYKSMLAAGRAFKNYSYGELFDLFTLQYEVDDFNRSQVDQICLYFAGDDRFNGDINKGLFLMGGVGIGKTSIMKFFLKNQRFSYRIDSCRDVEMNYSAYGDDYMEKVSKNLTVAVNADPFGHKEIGYCFDDLGTESNGKHFGKEKNVMADIILNRYDNQLPFISTHITTNLPADKIKELYGTRVTDRLNQMFNLIKFPKGAKSRRK